MDLFQKTFIRIIRPIIISIGLILVLGFILFLLLIGTGVALYQSESFQNGLMQYYKNQVIYQVDKKTWYDFSPVIDLSNLAVFSSELSSHSQKPLVEIAHVHCRINLWKSLIHFTFVTDDLNLTGMKINLPSQPASSFNSSLNSLNSLNSGNLIQWFFLQGNVSLDQHYVQFLPAGGINLEKLEIIWKKNALLGTHNFAINLEGPHLEILLSRLALPNTQWIALSGKLQFSGEVTKTQVKSLQAEMHLDHLIIKQTLPEYSRFDFLESKNFLNHFFGIVEANNLNLTLNFLDQKGSGNLNIGKIDLGPNSLFLKALPSMSINSSWNLDKDEAKSGENINLEKLEINTAHLNLNLQGRLKFSAKSSYLDGWEGKFLNQNDLNLDWNNPELNLSGHLEGWHLEEVLNNYLPEKGLTPKLKNWLSTEIKRVPQLSSDLNWTGRLHDFPEGFDLKTNVNQGALYPWSSWPLIENIQGYFEFKGPHFLAEITKGESAGVTIANALINIPNIMPGIPTNLSVQGNLNTQDNLPEKYINQSPLASEIKIFNYLSLEGPYKININLLFPLQQPTVPNEYQEQVIFNNNTIQPVNSPLNSSMLISNFSGDIRIQDQAVSATNLKGQLWGEDLLGKIQTSFDSNFDSKNQDQKTMHIYLSWLFNAKNVLKKSKEKPSLNLISGRTPIKAQIDLLPNGVNIQAESTGLGIQSNFPAPLDKKDPNTTWPFVFKFRELDQKTMNLELSLSHSDNHHLDNNFETVFNLTGAWAWDEKSSWKLINGSLTSGENSRLTPVLGTSFRIALALPNIAIDLWEQDFSALASLVKSNHSNHSNHFIDPISLINSWPIWPVEGFVRIEDLSLAKMHWKPVIIQINGMSVNNLHNLNFQIQTPDLNGALNIPVGKNLTDQNTPWDLKLTEWHLPELININNSTDSDPIKIQASQLNNLPPLNISIEHLFEGTRDLGRVSGSTRSLPLGMAVQNFSWKNDFVDLSGNGEWQLRDFHISGTSNGTDYGKLLSLLGFKSFLSQTKGDINFDLAWQGGIFTPDLKTLEGKVNFNLANGTLLDVNPGISRFLGLFSLEAISRRLSFNFKDMTGKGLAFDTLKGSYDLEQGVANTEKLNLTGPALDLSLKGTIDIPHQTLDQRVTVVPQISSGMTIVATILGGPIAGVATWLVDHLLGDTLFKNAGLVYHLYGPWDKPEFKIENQNKNA